MQDIDHLKCILDRGNISSAHILQFALDFDDQILYITEARSNKIEVLSLKDHHGEQCLESQQLLQEEIKSVLQEEIKHLMGAEQNEQRKRRFLSRKKTNYSRLQGLEIEEKTLFDICKDDKIRP